MIIHILNNSVLVNMTVDIRPDGSGSVLSCGCLAVLDYIALYSIVLCLTFIQNVTTYYPILIWQKWTKYRTKVVIYGNFVHTQVTYKGITNCST